MNHDEYSSFDATGLAELVSKGDVSAKATGQALRLDPHAAALGLRLGSGRIRAGHFTPGTREAGPRIRSFPGFAAKNARVGCLVAKSFVNSPP